MLYSILLSILLSFAAANPVRNEAELFELPVVHVNDFHARFDEVSTSAGNCNDPATCIGGFSRLYSQIQSLLAEKPKSLLLNGGDNFQGTLYYSLGKWNITQEFMNKLPFDATVLGNHEFDDGIAGVAPFIKSLKTPVICANINDDEEPDIQGSYTKSVVVERDGKKIGIIGVIYSKTNTISSTGSLVFYPESASVNAEAERLVEEEGVFTNIVLSHVGYDIDQAIAANASAKIGLIVGAHSHTFLYTGDNPPGPDTPGGPYPTIVEGKNGQTVLIVQASAYTKYLGNITVYYNSDGDVADYSGSPIFLENNIPKDEEIDTALEPWNAIVDAEGSVVIGSSLVKLSKAGCYYHECTLGNFVTDAFVFAYTQNGLNGSWTRAPIGIINAGGLRTDIEIGNITYSDMLTAQPFSNTVDYGELEGRYLKEMLEQSAGAYDNERISSELKLIQVSGIHVVYNISNPVGERVVELKVRCQQCEVPEYKDLDLDATYSLAVPSFIAGDNWYTSPALSTYLFQHKTNSVVQLGLTETRCQIYQENWRSQTVSMASDNILAVRWKGRRDRRGMLTTFRKDQRIQLNKKDREFVKKPECVVHYNQNMRAVDRTDIMLSSTECVIPNPTSRNVSTSRFSIEPYSKAD